MTKDATLKERQNAFTRQLILSAAVQQLQDDPAAGTTVRAVALRANLAERTVFRYFATRDDLLDTLAVEVSARIELPPLPSDAALLPQTALAFYRAFDAHGNLIRAALRSELFDRIRESVARERWRAVKSLVDAFAPRRPERDRMLAAANIRYLLSATSWNYYRSYFGFSLADSAAAAALSIQQSLDGLRPVPAKRRQDPARRDGGGRRKGAPEGRNL
ncbi:MAG: TetR/AcrR family transcriptional regulator [Ramlibacter sp.]